MRFVPPSVDGVPGEIFRSTGTKKIAAAKWIGGQIIESSERSCVTSVTASLAIISAAHQNFPRMAIHQLRRLHLNNPGKDHSSIRDVVHAMICRSGPLNHGSEVAWSLWAALTFGLTISKAAVNEVLRMADDCSILLLLHAAERSLTEIKPRLSAVTRLLYPEVLRGPHWLLAYETLLKGWITAPSGTNYIASEPVFEFLRQQNVHFYNTAVIQEEEEEEVVSGYGS